MPANSADSATPSAAETDLQGLELAEHHFGPLLCPTRATQSAWTNYSINRLQTNEKYRTVVSASCKGSEEDSEEDSGEYEHDERSNEAWFFDHVKACVSRIEKEMNMEDGILQKCTIVLGGETAPGEEPRYVIRIYSPAVPMYIDVNFQYYCRSRRSEVEWFCSLGKGSPPNVHTRNGWQTMCWGYYHGSNENYGEEDWPRIERGKVELDEDGVMDIYEVLFGELEKPAEPDSEAMLAYRRSLVRGMRLLLAAVGISYNAACTDDESDGGSHELMLERPGDKWVGRGIRNACGFWLARDAEKERKGAQERQEEAEGYDDDEDEDEDEDEDDDDDDDIDDEDDEDEDEDDDDDNDDDEDDGF
ncbi:hypothetical protein BDR03DRAFT_1015640 [Suillus americanus]|nr:hypothetical protein BDR03DRAFT_1015640 [Suillus americanus]